MSEYRKAWIAGAFMAALAGLEVAQKVIPMSEPTKNWVSVALAVLGAVAVYAVPNAGAVPKKPAAKYLDSAR